MQASAVIPQTQIKEEQYRFLLHDFEAVTIGNLATLANLASIASTLHHELNLFWTGFYLVKNGKLTLGPFRGPITNTRFPSGKGICSTAYAEERTICVEDVEQFPGYVPENEWGNAEMVIPGFKNGEVVLLLRVNKNYPAKFDCTDKKYLLKIMHNIERLL